MKYIAICDSLSCLSKVGKVHSDFTAGVIKQVSIHKTDCPDCGSILLWKKESKSYGKKKYYGRVMS